MTVGMFWLAMSIVWMIFAVFGVLTSSPVTALIGILSAIFCIAVKDILKALETK